VAVVVVIIAVRGGQDMVVGTKVHQWVSAGLSHH